MSVCWVRGRSGLLEQRAQVRADEMREERRYLEDPPVTTSMGPMIRPRHHPIRTRPAVDVAAALPQAFRLRSAARPSRSWGVLGHPSKE